MQKCLVRSEQQFTSQHSGRNVGQAMEMEQAIAAANQAMMNHLGRHLSDVETEILKGSWNGQTYDQIAAASGYSDSYLRRDVGTKFWRFLGQSLGETVSKNNFRGALGRYAETQMSPPSQPSLSPLELEGQRAGHLMSAPAPIVPSPQSINPSNINPSNINPGNINPSNINPSNINPSNYDEPYVARSSLESVCYNSLLQPGALIRVKAPSLMGKTVLMDHVLAQLAADGVRTVNLSLKLADRKIHFSDLNRFLRWLCINISRSLKLPHQIDEYWDEEGMGSKVSCSTYVEEYLLAESDRPLVLCLDDVDLLFPYPEIYEDFFGLLRSWYEIARSRSHRIWKKLRLAIVHSTDVYIQLNLNQSPFNVGVPIELPELSFAQTQDLAQQHGLPPDMDLTSLMDMVGGHPYLLAQAFDALKHHSDLSLPQLLNDAPTETGIYTNHLRDHWLMLRDQPEMKQLLSAVMTRQESVQLNTVQAHHLHSMGLIKLAGNIATPRCQLYRHYFRTQLGTL